MDRASGQLFAGSTLSLQKNRGFGWRNLSDGFVDLSHARALAHEVVSDVQLITQTAILSFQVLDLREPFAERECRCLR